MLRILESGWTYSDIVACWHCFGRKETNSLTNWQLKYNHKRGEGQAAIAGGRAEAGEPTLRAVGQES